MAIRPHHILPGLLLTCAVLAPAHAAELGDARVLSHIGQPLSALVELTLVEDASKPVMAQLARPDVYRGANIAMPPVLSGLDIAVIRQGGKQFLRLASVKPVESKHLHVYLELVDGGQRTVRLVTLWLTPDPDPAPPPAPVPAPAPPAPAIAAAPAAPAPVAAPEATEPPKPVTQPVRKPAPPKRPPAQPEPDAHAAASGHDARAPKPSAPAIKPIKPINIEQHGKKPAADLARPAAAAAPSCAPTPSATALDACTVLGAKNEALRQELGRLEDKVKVLQVASGVKAAGPAPAEAGAGPDSTPEAKTEATPEAKTEATPEAKTESRPEARPDDKPKSAPRIHRKPKPAPPPEEPLPWLAIGGAIAGLLALAAGMLLLRRRRAAAGKVLKTAREPEVVVLPQDGGADGLAKPSFMSAVKARLMALRLGKRPAQAARVEPDTPETAPATQPE
ncbi:hypothetical protein [Massilia sp.]|uniref:FimV/HubP-related protein n=1 Tax=Massilia sp. TaxID=1882437 RepID=UPI0028B1FD65|nr:hypothetical protein [Massilia sp.]